MLGEDSMRALLGTGAAALALAMAGQAAAAELVFDETVARVVVIPEARADIQVEVRPGRNGAPALRVVRIGDRVSVSGGSRVRQCNFDGDSGWIKLKGGPRIDMDDAAYVTVRAPRDVRISGGGAILGSIGRSQTLRLDQSGCANWTAADVSGDLHAALSNGASLKAGAARTAHLTATNGGAVRVVRAERLEATAVGGGVVKANTAGVVVATATGGGMVSIEGGASRSLAGTAAGGGHIRHNGRVGELDADASGGAVIRVAQAGRVLSRSARGGSSVVVNDSAD
jgi:hypothetical protein